MVCIVMAERALKNKTFPPPFFFPTVVREYVYALTRVHIREHTQPDYRSIARGGHARVCFVFTIVIFVKKIIKNSVLSSGTIKK